MYFCTISVFRGLFSPPISPATHRLSPSHSLCTVMPFPRLLFSPGFTIHTRSPSCARSSCV